MSGSEPNESERVEAAAALLERLISDPAFRTLFRAQPEAACREAGLHDLADEIRMGGGALQTLEVRESRSSLLGVLMAAALEGVGVLELSRLGGGLSGEAARAAHLASTRAGLRAVRNPGAALHAPRVPHAPHLPHAPRVPHAPHLPHAPRVPHAPPLPHAPRGVAAAANAAGDAGAPPAGAAAAAPPAGAAPPVAGAPAPPDAAPAAAAAPPGAAASAAPAGSPAVPGSGWGDEGATPAGGGAADAGGWGAGAPRAVAAAAPPAAGGGPLQPLIDQQRVQLAPGMTPDSIDPRMAGVLGTLAAHHQLGLKMIDGQGVDIATVDGLPVGPDNPAARDLIGELAALDPAQRPTQVIGPWAVSAPGFATDAAHQDHIHLGFDGGAAAPGVGGTIRFAAVPDPAAAGQQPPAGAAGAAAEAPRPAAPVDAAQPGAGAVVDAAPGGGGFDLTAAERDYPGDQASKAQIAGWMGRWAERAGLPRELPAMASLVESGMTNIQGGDRDSMGFFQMRTGIWSRDYPDFQHHPALQLKWFIDHAVAVKEQRIARGETAFQHDPGQYGNWIADVERPAEPYRGRYQLRLGEARSLLAQGGSAPPAAPAPTPVAAAASVPPQAPPAAGAATPAAAPGTISFGAVPPPEAAAAPPAGDVAAVTAAPGAGAGVSPLVPGSSITAPGTASHELRQIFERAATLDARHMPYLWGGGHQGGALDVTSTGPLDCSGAVSAVLGVDPRVSGAFEQWGLPGPGANVTVYANAEHVLMEINGHFFGTSASNPGGGAGWIPREHVTPEYLSRFVARHPPGM